MLKTTKENLLKVLERSLFIMLCIVSLFFMKEVLTQLLTKIWYLFTFLNYSYNQLIYDIKQKCKQT